MTDTGITVRRKRGYTVVFNDLLPADGVLSARAWGVFVYLIGRPDGWQCRTSHLQTVFREGRDALYSALRELEGVGLMAKVDTIEDGMRRTRYELNADPQTPRSAPGTDSQDSGNQDPGNQSPGGQDAGNPDPEKPGQVSKDSPTERATTEGATTDRATAATAAAADRTKGSRLPTDWWPDAGLQDWYRAQPYANVMDPRVITEEFCRFWWTKTGANATKLDWRQTWQNWMSREGRRAMAGSNGRAIDNRHVSEPGSAQRAALSGWMESSPPPVDAK